VPNHGEFIEANRLRILRSALWSFDKMPKGKTGVLANYLSVEELAAELDVTPVTLWHWRRRGMGPPVTRLGNMPYFRREAVEQWLLRCEKKMPREAQRRKRSTPTQHAIT
jgi:hypothetical protein